MKGHNINLAFVCTILSFLFVGCVGYPETPMEKFPGENDRNEIFFFFKKDTTNDQINHFLNYEIGVPHPEGRGFGLMEGIRGEMSISRQGYEGYSLELRPNIPDEQRQKILNVINNSPIIYRVYENAIPNEVVSDPNYKDSNGTPNMKGDGPIKKDISSNK